MPSIPSELLAKVLIGAAILVFFSATAWLRYSVKIVPENKRLVIFRMGKCRGSYGPGLVTVIPIIDKAVWVELERTYGYQYEGIITADERKVSCTVKLEGRVIDAEKSVMDVPNLEQALSQVIETQLQVIVKSKTSAELMTLGEWMAGQLTDAINWTSRSWGFEATKISVTELRQE